jgi:hypothetical protein
MYHFENGHCDCCVNNYDLGPIKEKFVDLFDDRGFFVLGFTNHKDYDAYCKEMGELLKASRVPCVSFMGCCNTTLCVKCLRRIADKLEASQ